MNFSKFGAREVKILFAVIIFSVLSTFTIAAGADFPSILPDKVIAKYGTPDIIDSTEYDKPRPPFVTKWLTYQKENVKFIFIADAPMGSPPPYKKWKLLGVQDIHSNAMLDAEEMQRRMSRRLRR